MTCPALERIYDYLDGGLSARERESFERHIAGCSGCRQALADRRAIAEAAESLPPFEVPADFVRGVMAGLPSPAAAENRAALPRPLRLSWALTGVSALGATAVAISLIAGNGIPGIFLGLGRSLKMTTLSVSPDILKAARVLSLFRRLAEDFLARLLDGFEIAASFIGSDVRIAIVATAAVLMIAAGAFFARKLILEKSHDPS